MHTEFLWGNLKERDHLDDLGVDGVIKLKYRLPKEVGLEDMYRIYLIQDRSR
jgi:hypothetical protein